MKKPDTPPSQLRSGFGQGYLASKILLFTPSEDRIWNWRTSAIMPGSPDVWGVCCVWGFFGANLGLSVLKTNVWAPKVAQFQNKVDSKIAHILTNEEGVFGWQNLKIGVISNRVEKRGWGLWVVNWKIGFGARWRRIKKKKGVIFMAHDAKPNVECPHPRDTYILVCKNTTVQIIHILVTVNIYVWLLQNTWGHSSAVDKMSAVATWTPETAGQAGTPGTVRFS